MSSNMQQITIGDEEQQVTRRNNGKHQKMTIVHDKEQQSMNSKHGENKFKNR